MKHITDENYDKLISILESINYTNPKTGETTTVIHIDKIKDLFEDPDNKRFYDIIKEYAKSKKDYEFALNRDYKPKQAIEFLRNMIQNTKSTIRMALPNFNSNILNDFLIINDLEMLLDNNKDIKIGILVSNPKIEKEHIEFYKNIIEKYPDQVFVQDGEGKSFKNSDDTKFGFIVSDDDMVYADSKIKDLIFANFNDRKTAGIACKLFDKEFEIQKFYEKPKSFLEKLVDKIRKK